MRYDIFVAVPDAAALAAAADATALMTRSLDDIIIY